MSWAMTGSTTVVMVGSVFGHVVSLAMTGSTTVVMVGPVSLVMLCHGPLQGPPLWSW